MGYVTMYGPSYGTFYGGVSLGSLGKGTGKNSSEYPWYSTDTDDEYDEVVNEADIGY